jgi:hypothetical protein
MAEDQPEKLEPPARTSLDDPGAHDIGEPDISLIMLQF